MHSLVGDVSFLRALAGCHGHGGEITPIHRWTGEYLGFLVEGWFYDGTGRYVGWVADGHRVWRANGSWLGELVDGCYVMRRVALAPPGVRTPPVPPVPRRPPDRPRARLPRQPRPGWVDGLEQVGRSPTPGELGGSWYQGGSHLILEQGGKYRWMPDRGEGSDGSWKLQGSSLSFVSSGEGEQTVYAILEYADASLTLRQFSNTQRTFELVLRRGAPSWR